MFGLAMYLMYLADYLRGRKNNIFCRLCGVKLKSNSDLDVHIRNNHKYDVVYP
jgi:hypothetical protein